jgi:hypothetical protein
MKKYFLLAILIISIPLNVLASCINYPNMVSDMSGNCICGQGFIWNGRQCANYNSYCIEKYGIGSDWNYLNSNCECRKGYIWGKNAIGSYCISGEQACDDNYGYSASYDYLSGNCKCGYGDVWSTDIFGKSTCVSGNSYCYKNYGYGSQFDAQSNGCVCMSGYIMSQDSYGNKKCAVGDDVCHEQFGINSSYVQYSNKCQCNQGYEFDINNKCIQKENIVNFYLKEVDLINNKIIVSDGLHYWLLDYQLGCNNNYLSNDIDKIIVINIGTNYEINRGDKIVLNQTESCEVKSVLSISSGFTFVKPIVDKIALSEKNPIKQVVVKKYATYNGIYNVRSAPSINSKVITQTKKFDKYEVADLSMKDWIKIKTIKGEGWVMKKFSNIK